MKVNVELIILCRWLCPIVPRNTLLSDHAVIIKSGKIIDICPNNDVDKYSAIEIVHLNEHILIPGLINLHTHAAMSLMRGLADDLPLMPLVARTYMASREKICIACFCI